ncbi:hypothetical protein [Pseudooctadecabacter jejudonensis]|uniref:Uncharacterized protein n=1 Tax=Pseudooctadecabacter jejudonensis TaxID=1391910 RepID=A0A1Y5S0L8_9RHOB|nr:hypothetical protein [Pseudooctadecabacter jejudonensis]SLN28895.1 hypothetical protein PSJ8397_01231 [Pseudooctadecabacter jejudonensis]
MKKLIFGLIPWWMFAVAAALFASVTAEMVEDHLTLRAIVERTLREGPPPVADLADVPLRGSSQLMEMHVQGQLRPDVGVLNYMDANRGHQFVLLDDPNATVVLALAAPNAEAADMITEIVDRASRDGTVTVQGLRTFDGVESALHSVRTAGVPKSVILMHPFRGSREDALKAHLFDDMMAPVISGIMTVVLGLLAVWKFRRWRRRRAVRRAAQVPQNARETPQGKSFPSPRPAPPPRTGQGGSPWASGVATTSATFADPEPARPTPNTFESVFPGGGSGFRFKSADEIIRETFGTVSTLERSKDAKPDD